MGDQFTDFAPRAHSIDGERSVGAALGQWLDKGAILAMIARRERMQVEIDKLVTANGEANVYVK